MMVRGERGGVRSGVSEPPTRFLLLAVWFGLLTGYLELCVLGAWKILLRELLFVSPHAVWMAPVVNVFLFSVPALLLLLLARRWPRLGSLRVVTAVLAFLAFSGALLMFHPKLNKYAALVLAAGLAVQASRLIATHPRGFASLVRRTAGGMVTLAAVLAVGQYAWERFAETRALASLPRSAAGAPNVLLIVLDTVRTKSLGLYGYHRSTAPALDRLAETGVLFEQVFATSPWTLPSHASMFTGRYPHELSAGWTTPLDATYPVLAEVLGAQGYVTAAFVANVTYTSYETGLLRGFAHYEDYRVSPGTALMSSSLGRFLSWSHNLRRLFGYYERLDRKYAERLTDDVLTWLSREGRRPFFVFLNYFDAHEPYLPPPPFDVKFPAKVPRKNSLIRYGWHGAGRIVKYEMTPEETQAELDAYEGSIAYLDHHVGRLLRDLQKRGELERTLVIVTSDHGTQHGEHGLFSHANSLYIPNLHVPLLISFPPRVPRGMKVREPVTLRSLPTTIVDLIRIQGPPVFPGRSLARYWGESGPATDPAADLVLSEVAKDTRTPPWYPTAKGALQSLMLGRYHYIRSADGREELYDLHADPAEKHDLGASPEARQVLNQARSALSDTLAADRTTEPVTR
ncbi:MAG: sulfatase [Candidatus Rokubacteria bacterium]|nr:sulfatase [Candidatus Rokubacteria bacterium]